MEEPEDEPLFCERAAGIDIGKQSVMVTVRVPSETRKGGRAQETREFGTTRRQLGELADWLRSHGVERAGMESTSDYWKPVYILLEQQGLECVLYQASKVKAQPGRPKTGKLDSVWLAKVTGQGSVAGSFVPPEDIRRLRACTRYRRRLTQAMTAEKQRVEKLLEDAHLKLPARDQRRPRRLRSGDAPRDRRRGAQPPGAGGDGPRRDAAQARGAARGPGLLVVHPGARLRAVDDAGQHRPLHQAGRRAGREDRRHVRAVRAAARPAGPDPGLRGEDRPGPDRRDRGGHERLPDRRAPVLLGPRGSPPEGVRRQAQGRQRHRERQSLH